MQRNRLKRLVREAFRREARALTRAWDIVVVVQSSKDGGPAPIAADLRQAFLAAEKPR